MDEQETSGTPGSTRRRLAVVLGAAALAIPGGALVSNALADSGTDGAAPSSLQPVQVQNGYGTPPAQGDEQAPGRSGGERPDGDCPNEGGGRGGPGAGAGTGSGPGSGSTGTETAPSTSTEQTPL